MKYYLDFVESKILIKILSSFSALDDLRNHLENPDSLIEMKFLLLEQKYLEYLSRGNSIDALKVSASYLVLAINYFTIYSSYCKLGCYESLKQDFKQLSFSAGTCHMACNIQSE